MNNLQADQGNLNDANTPYCSVIGAAPWALYESDIAGTEKQYTAAQSMLCPGLDAEFVKNADNNVGGQEGHYNGWSAMLRMQFYSCAGASGWTLSDRRR